MHYVPEKLVSSVRRILPLKLRQDYSDLPRFPDDFLWGVGTSAYQVEGNITRNDWHVFTTTPEIKERIKLLSSLITREIDLQPAGEAVHHGNIEVLKEDLERARLLGMNSYRFSIEWSRIQPSPGYVDDAAIKDYHDALEEMHKRGLKPIVTLNHLSLPVWVLTPPSGFIVTEDEGFCNSLRGWESDATVDAFVEFVKIVVERFKDIVDIWITINEPVATVIGIGYIAGGFPPGFNLDGERAKKAYFNLTRAHVRSYREIKSIYGNRPSSVGIAHAVMYPKITNAAMGMTIGAILGIIVGGGIGANIGLYVLGQSAIPWGAGIGILLGIIAGVIIGGAQDKHKIAAKQFDYFYNFHYLDSLINGRVDKAIQQNEKKRDYEDTRTFLGLPVSEEWKPHIDFIGINYYRSVYVFYNKIMSMQADFTGGAIDNDLRGTMEKYNLLNDLGWEIYPEGLFHFIKTLNDRYHLPILVTENGIPQLADRNRAPFITGHLQQLSLAIKEGARVMGYIHWSLLDNWELLEAYSEGSRFGLFAVDRSIDIRSTGARTYPRHITEGALALQYAISSGRIREAIERFGMISPKGDRVEVGPEIKTAGAFWEGNTEDGQRFTLYINALENENLQSRFIGMVFYHDVKKWVRLSFEGPLKFSHDTCGFTKERDFEARISDGDIIDGKIIEGDLMKRWSAKKLKLYGLWNIISGKPPFDKLYFSRMEGDDTGWKGKALLRSPPVWDVLDSIDLEGGKLRFKYVGVEYKCDISVDVINCFMGYDNKPSWIARKAPDGLAF